MALKEERRGKGGYDRLTQLLRYYVVPYFMISQGRRDGSLGRGEGLVFSLVLRMVGV